MKLSQSSLSQIEKAIGQAIAKYRCCEETIVTDIHLQAHPESGELLIFDDDDILLGNTTIDEWTNYEGDDFYTDVERILSTLLNNMKTAGDLDKLALMKPDDKETIAELLLMDDDTLLLNDELLKGLDEELDSFLKDLLEK